MIKGKAIATFGTGDIRITSSLNNGSGVISLTEYSPAQEIGSTLPLDKNWTPLSSDVILSFSRIKSIEVLIEHLEEVKRYMLGEFRGNELQTEPVDLDSFLEGKYNSK